MTFRHRLISYSPYLLSALFLLAIAVPQVVEANFVTNTLRGVLYFVVVNFFGWLLWVAGELLDWSIQTFVIDFGNSFVNGGAGVAVDALWVTVRDFFNILFIFGLVYIGFQLILDSDNPGTRKALVYLVMAALLVNFSLFITKFVVDFTNTLATQVVLNGFPTVGGQAAIADVFFNEMKIAETLNVDNGINTQETAEWSFIFGSALIYLIGAFVFFSGAIMIILRFVALCVYMVLSPFMFVGWVFPGFSSMTRKYWSGFLGRAFYAPVYVVLIYFAAFILHEMFSGGAVQTNLGALNPSNGGASVAGGPNNGQVFAGILGPFILSSAFMIAAVQVAGKLSADGAGTVMKVGNNLARRGQRAATYLPRRAGSKGVGIAANQWDKRIEQSNSRAARMTRGLITGASLGLVDARERQRLVKAGKNTKFGTAYSHADDIENKTTQKKIASRRENRAKDEAAIKAAEGIDIKTENKEEKALLDKAERAANNYTQEELEKMSEKQREGVMRYLKANTVGKLLDSDNLSVGEKGKVQEQYKNEIEKQITEGGEIITDELAKLSGKQLEVLGIDFATKYAPEFTEDQMDAYKKSDNFTERQKDGLKAVRKSERKKAAENQALRQRMFYGTKYGVNDEGYVGVIPNEKPRKANEIASLPYDAFIQNGALTQEARRSMNADVLKQIARNANQGKPTMSDDERTELANNLLAQSSVSPGIANYLTSKKGQEDFFLNLSPSQEERIKDASRTNQATGGTMGM